MKRAPGRPGGPRRGKTMKFRLPILGAALAATLLAPLAGRADPVVTNPFGTLTTTIDAAHNVAHLTIVSRSGAVTGKQNADGSYPTVYFGLRLMGGEDMQMTGFKVDKPT